MIQERLLQTSVQMLEKFASVQLTRFSLASPFWDVVLQGPGHSWETSKQFSPVLGEAMCHLGGSWSRLSRGKPRLALAAKVLPFDFPVF